LSSFKTREPEHIPLKQDVKVPDLGLFTTHNEDEPMPSLDGSRGRSPYESASAPPPRNGAAGGRRDRSPSSSSEDDAPGMPPLPLPPAGRPAPSPQQQQPRQEPPPSSPRRAPSPQPAPLPTPSEKPASLSPPAGALGAGGPANRWEWPPWCLNFKKPCIEVWVFDDDTNQGKWVSAEPQTRVVDKNGRDAYLCAEYCWDGEYFVQDFGPQHVRRRGHKETVFDMLNRPAAGGDDLENTVLGPGRKRNDTGGGISHLLDD